MIRNTLAAIAATAALAAPALADPFATSTQFCDSHRDDPSVGCVYRASHTSGKTLVVRDALSRRVLASYGFETIRDWNGWEEGEVTLDTEVPVGSGFVVRLSG